MEYKFGTKNNWRRWAWNNIKSRLTVPVKDAVCLYLGASDDYDREIALAKGFSPNNLILVDKSAAIVANARKAGKLAIHGDLISVVQSWPVGLPLHVVFGDFCGGVSNRIAVRISSGFSVFPQTRQCVFAFNFLAGRERGAMGLIERFGNVPADAGQEKFLSGLAVNQRAISVANLMLVATLHWITGRGELYSYGLKYRMDNSLIDEFECPEWTDLLDHFSYVFSPAAKSYISTSNQRFDSVVFRHPLAHSPDVGAYLTKQDAFIRKNNGGELRRQIAAVAAHRTMRKRA